MMKYSFGEFKQQESQPARLQALEQCIAQSRSLGDIECIHEQPSLIENYA